MIYLTSGIKNETEQNVCNMDKLIEGIAAGDEISFETLYKTTQASVYSFALSILKNTQDAEDVLHDCFINIHAAAASYRKKGKAKAWIMTIAYHLCMQKLRERKKFSEVPQEDWEPFLESAEGITPEEKIVLEQCMNRLSDEERQIIVLHAVSGFKHREIAAMLKLPLPTVLSKYNRAIKKLRESM